MKKIGCFLGVFAVIFCLSFRTTAPKKVFTLTIRNVKDNNARIVIGVFNNPNTFPDKVVYKKYTAYPSANKTATISIEDLDYGVYAISMFQDKNSDYRLNTNFIGMPVEPYAFSNNFRPKFSAPGFSDCKFVYDEHFHSMEIELIQ